MSKSIYKTHFDLKSKLVKLIENNYDIEKWKSFSLERQISEFLQYMEDLNEIKSTDLSNVQNNNKKIKLTCGCYVDELLESHSVKIKALTRDCHKAVDYATYCEQCKKTLRDSGDLLETELDIKNYLTSE